MTSVIRDFHVYLNEMNIITVLIDQGENSSFL